MSSTDKQTDNQRYQKHSLLCKDNADGDGDGNGDDDNDDDDDDDDDEITITIVTMMTMTTSMMINCLTSNVKKGSVNRKILFSDCHGEVAMRVVVHKHIEQRCN